MTRIRTLRRRARRRRSRACRRRGSRRASVSTTSRASPTSRSRRCRRTASGWSTASTRRTSRRTRRNTTSGACAGTAAESAPSRSTADADEWRLPSARTASGSRSCRTAATRMRRRRSGSCRRRWRGRRAHRISRRRLAISTGRPTARGSRSSPPIPSAAGGEEARRTRADRHRPLLLQGGRRRLPDRRAPAPVPVRDRGPEGDPAHLRARTTSACPPGRRTARDRLRHQARRRPGSPPQLDIYVVEARAGARSGR